MYIIDLLRQMKQTLIQAGISEGEASALVFMLTEEITGLTKAQILTADTKGIDTQRLTELTQTIANGTPIQYALGYSYFCGLKLRVTPSVLIPRPETEELVRWATESTTAPLSILDIGTGSGCIAIALAKAFPKASVTAIDISNEALTIAKKNTADHKVCIHFHQLDILTQPLPQYTPFDIIISNPPYICKSESAHMEANVLQHEPHTALFVPDSDPLLFYRAISEKALPLLSPRNGALYFEINRKYAPQLKEMLISIGYRNVTVNKDQFGNDRMIRATLNP